MRNGKKSLKKASVLLTTFLLVVMCLAVDTTTEQNKAYLDPGQEIPFKGKRHKKESEMVLHKEISGNCQ